MSISAGSYTARCVNHPTSPLILKEYRLQGGIDMPLFACATCGHMFTTNVGIRLLNHKVGNSKTLEEHAMSAMKDFN
jgi:hypothetical protein